MIAKLTLGKLLVAAVGLNAATLVASFGQHVDAWAPFANTLLLIVLAVLARHNGRQIQETHESVHATAQVALTAAQAAAEAERVAKSIGSTLREHNATQPPSRDVPDPPQAHAG